MIKSIEHIEQCAVVEWARLNPENIPYLEMLYAIPNGGLRNIKVAAKMKREGVLEGIPGLCWPINKGAYGALYIEMKKKEDNKKGRLSKEQKGVFLELVEMFNCVVVACSADEAIHYIRAYHLGFDNCGGGWV